MHFVIKEGTRTDILFYAIGDFVPQCVPGVGLGDRGVQPGPDGVVNDDVSPHYCLVAIGRLQVTSTPNTNDLTGPNSNSGEFHSLKQ